MFIPIVKLIIPTVPQASEANSEIETHPVIVETKIKK